MARYAPSDQPGYTMDPDDELSNYFHLDPKDANCLGVDPLKWWQMHRERFPNLSRLARDIFSIPGELSLTYVVYVFLLNINSQCKLLGCAVAVERIFSSGRDTISLRRASLKPSTIRSLMLLKQRLLLARRGMSRMLAAMSSTSKTL